MCRLKLVLPSLEYKSQILDYKKEFIDNGERLYGTGGLKVGKSFEDWLESVCKNLKEETVEDGLVPSATYIALSEDNNSILGMISLRYRLNDQLLYSGGHIGYSVRKSERNKGYGSKMLSLGLEEYKRMRFDRVLVSCDKDNLGSAKTILKNGGVLENEVKEDNTIVERYWINLA